MQNPRVKYSKKFLKEFQKTPLKVQVAFRERRKLFVKDPLNPLLRNHALAGRLKGYRSINVTGDWRALYSQTQEDRLTIKFEAIGTHSQLYG